MNTLMSGLFVCDGHFLANFLRENQFVMNQMAIFVFRRPIDSVSTHTTSTHLWWTHYVIFNITVSNGRRSCQMWSDVVRLIIFIYKEPESGHRSLAISSRHEGNCNMKNWSFIISPFHEGIGQYQVLMITCCLSFCQSVLDFHRISKFPFTQCIHTLIIDAWSNINQNVILHDMKRKFSRFTKNTKKTYWPNG